MPGLGPKSARRILLHLIKHKKELLGPLVNSLQNLQANIRECEYCFAFDSKSPCVICTNPERDHTILCIVGDIIDMWAIEKARHYIGVYHVLGGVLSATCGYSPKKLTFDQLFERIKKTKFKEIIIALNPTVDGQTTMAYLMHELKSYPIKVTTLAHGIPLGGELDYIDNGTIGMAFLNRSEVK